MTTDPLLVMQPRTVAGIHRLGAQVEWTDDIVSLAQRQSPLRFEGVAPVRHSCRGRYSRDEARYPHAVGYRDEELALRARNQALLDENEQLKRERDATRTPPAVAPVGAKELTSKTRPRTRRLSVAQRLWLIGLLFVGSCFGTLHWLDRKWQAFWADTSSPTKPEAPVTYPYGVCIREAECETSWSKERSSIDLRPRCEERGGKWLLPTPEWEAETRGTVAKYCPPGETATCHFSLDGYPSLERSYYPGFGVAARRKPTSDAALRSARSDCEAAAPPQPCGRGGRSTCLPKFYEASSSPSQPPPHALSSSVVYADTPPPSTPSAPARRPRRPPSPSPSNSGE